MNPGLADWRPLITLLAAFGAVVAALMFVRKRREGYGPADLLRRAARGMEFVTKIPGWASVSVGMATFGLLVAGMGFYNDVAWHVRLGRDDELFTAPHTAIVFGLLFILSAGVHGIAIATVDRIPTRLRIGRVRVPWSMIPMTLLGASAVAGFPLDDLWHRAYGIDVTMWSPTHLLMIVGASLSPIASWLALAEAGVKPSDGRWARGVHVAVASLVLLGLSSVQGEFAFGVPQFQQLYHPILVMLAGGLALVAARVALGPWWTLVVAGVGYLFSTGDRFGRAGDDVSRLAAVYLVSAVAVELVGWLAGTSRRLRFALVAGAAVGTIGLAGEWWWNQGAFQPWTTALLPDAVVLGVVVGLAAAVVGTALGSAVRRERSGPGGAVLVLAGVVLVIGLAWPLPRRTGDVRAEVVLATTAESAPVVVGVAWIGVRLDPVDAAQGARWFQAIAWQGGGFVAADMVERAPGTYVSEVPVPVSGDWKTLVRLHRGAELMAVPVWLPADPEIGAPEIPAVDRDVAFEGEERYLLREQHPGPGWLAPAIYALFGAIALAWVTMFVLAARSIALPSEREMAAV